MNITRSIVLSLSLFSFGCSAVSATTSQTSTTAQQLVVEVPNAPPDPQPDVKTACPGPGHIWVAGYWDYIAGHHVWREGRWLQGKPDYEYVRARYEQSNGGWVFHRPHWKRRHSSSATTTANARGRTS